MNLYPWLFDLADIENKLREDNDNPDALEALKQIIDSDIYQIKKGELLEKRIDGFIYETNLPYVVWREGDFKMKNSYSPLSIFSFKIYEKYTLEQRVCGSSLKNCKLKKKDLDKIFEFITTNYISVKNQYDFSDDNIIIGDKRNVKFLISRSILNENPLSDLYNFLIRMRDEKRIRSVYLDFFTEDWNNKSPGDLIEYMLKINPWISFGNTSISEVQIKMNFNAPVHLHSELEKLFNYLKLSPPKIQIIDYNIIYRNIKALQLYTTSSDYFNDDLRKRLDFEPLKMKNFNNILDCIDAVNAIENEYILYRGTLMNPFINSKTFIDKGFSSKSSVKSSALGFAGSYLLRIIYPSGTKQLALESITSNRSEDEYLTYPGEIIKYVGEINRFNYTEIICLHVGYENIKMKIDFKKIEKMRHFADIIFHHLYNKEDVESEIITEYYKVYNNLNIYTAYDFLYQHIENVESIKFHSVYEKIPLPLIDNEFFYLQNANILQILHHLLPFIEYEIRESVISYEAYSILQNIKKMTKSLHIPGKPFKLYRSSKKDIIKCMKIEADEEYSIPVMFRGDEKLLYTFSYFFDVENIKIPLIDSRIDEDINGKINFLLKLAYEKSAYSFWIIDYNNNFTDVKFTDYFYQTLFYFFRANRVKYIGVFPRDHFRDEDENFLINKNYKNSLLKFNGDTSIFKAEWTFEMVNGKLIQFIF